jgi:hypothetical protein
VAGGESGADDASDADRGDAQDLSGAGQVPLYFGGPGGGSRLMRNMGAGAMTGADSGKAWI